MKYTTKEITFIALTAALMVVVGYVLYSVSAILPIPGSKFIIHSSFLSFVLTLPVVHIRKIGTISMINFVFSFIMFFISPYMGLAILTSGLFTEIVGFLIFRNYNSSKKVLFTVALYPVFSLLTSFFVTNYITGNTIYLVIGNKLTLIVLSIIIYGLGLLGSYSALKILPKRVLHKNKDINI
ncbi:hypothetical protein [Dethiothermospora halolimnae]|uniref:hypothetical protein n=1 Tax=Dethiothermospora halolimnae TaxID=3114390 RepID=UPI003CCBB613